MDLNLIYITTLSFTFQLIFHIIYQIIIFSASKIVLFFCLKIFQWLSILLKNVKLLNVVYKVIRPLMPSYHSVLAVLTNLSFPLHSNYSELLPCLQNTRVIYALPNALEHSIPQSRIIIISFLKTSLALPSLSK